MTDLNKRMMDAAQKGDSNAVNAIQVIRANWR
jgi:hypothetical protein